MVAAGELEAGEEMEAEEEMGDMEELDEMDEVSWKKKNGESLENLAPTKVGQTTVNEAEDVEEVTGASGGYDPGKNRRDILPDLFRFSGRTPAEQCRPQVRRASYIDGGITAGPSAGN
jgi:hypothetical protein